MKKGGYVYIMTNKSNKVLYTGVTNNIERRVEQHKSGTGNAFTKRYNLTKLVFSSQFPTIEQAIAEEKRIKGGPRAQKIELIEGDNPGWVDLASDS